MDDTPEDPTTAAFRRNLGLKIHNLTVNDQNEITWLSIECRKKVQGLYPRGPSDAGAPVAWVRYRSDGGFEGPIMDTDSRMCDTRRSFWTPLYAAPVAPAAPFDMLAHLARQREFSERTFGPGARTKGVCDHIRKELNEIESNPSDLTEWIDVVILALDGAWRAGGSPQQIIDALVAKQTKNEGRMWPDWRTADPNKAIEHDRSQDTCAQCEGKGTVVFRDPEEAWDMTCGLCDGTGRAAPTPTVATDAAAPSEQPCGICESDCGAEESGYACPQSDERGAFPTDVQICAMGACASLAESMGNEEIAKHVRDYLAARAASPQSATSPERMSDAGEACRIWEYDGAFRCMTHQNTWGAIGKPTINDPSAPCAARQAEIEREGGSNA